MQALAEVELSWMEKIRQEGEQAGMRQLLLLQLTQKFGELPKEFVARLNEVSDQADLAQISSQVLTAQRLSDVILPPIQATIMANHQ